MIVQRTAAAAFTAEFENEQELRDEHRANLSFGALRLSTSESVALHTVLQVTLRGPWAGEIGVRATVVAVLADRTERAFLSRTTTRECCSRSCKILGWDRN